MHFFYFLLFSVILKTLVCYSFLYFIKEIISPSFVYFLFAAPTFIYNSINDYYDHYIRLSYSFLILNLNVYFKAPLRLTCTCLYFIIHAPLVYFCLNCFTVGSRILLRVGILKYFYSSLYLHILFAYVFALCCIYAVFAEYYGMHNIIYFIVNVRWSWFFYTKEEVERSRNT